MEPRLSLFEVAPSTLLSKFHHVECEEERKLISRQRERPSSFYAGMGKRDNKVGGGDGVCHMRPQLDLCSTCANTEIKDNAVRLSASCGSFGIIIQI